jgi:hypothetical protein
MFDGLGPLARGSRQYAAVLAINTFMKECLPKRKSDRGTAKQLFYSVVRLKKKDRWQLLGRSAGRLHPQR